MKKTQNEVKRFQKYRHLNVCVFRTLKNKEKMAEEVVEDYKTSLADLTFNSKVHITVLTMLAEDNKEYFKEIAQVVEAHLKKVSLHLFSIMIVNFKGIFHVFFVTIS